MWTVTGQRNISVCLSGAGGRHTLGGDQGLGDGSSRPEKKETGIDKTSCQQIVAAARKRTSALGWWMDMMSVRL